MTYSDSEKHSIHDNSPDLVEENDEIIANLRKKGTSNVLTIPEMMSKLNHIHNFTADYQKMTESFELMQAKLKSIDKQLEQFVTYTYLENQFRKEQDLTNEDLISFKYNVNEKISNLSKMKMDTSDCLFKISHLAPMKALDKFNKSIFELKNEVEKNISNKFHTQIADIKYNLKDNIKLDDINKVLENYPTKEELKKVELDFDSFDFKLKGKKLRKFIEKVINDYDEDEVEYGSDDVSSDYNSELEDEIQVNDMQINPLSQRVNNSTDSPSGDHKHSLKQKSMKQDGHSPSKRHRKSKHLQKESVKNKPKEEKEEDYEDDDEDEDSIDDLEDPDEEEVQFEEQIIAPLPQMPKSSAAKPVNPLDLGGLKRNQQPVVDKTVENNVNNNVGSEPDSNAVKTTQDTVVPTQMTQVPTNQSLPDEMAEKSQEISITPRTHHEVNKSKKSMKSDEGSNLSNFVENQKDLSKSGSKKSEMSTREKKNGNNVSNIVIKGLQDKVEGISKNIEEIYSKAHENYGRVNKFVDEFNAMKKLSDAEQVYRKKLDDRLHLADQNCKELDEKYEKYKEQHTEINANLVSLGKNQTVIKEIVTSFEKINDRDNEHKMKQIVNLKIEIQQLESEFKFFKKEFFTKMQEVKKELVNSRINKENIETNFKNIINTFSSKFSHLTHQVSDLKSSHDYVKKPIVEYCDMLTKEFNHISQQNTNYQNTTSNYYRVTKENGRYNDSSIDKTNTSFQVNTNLPEVISMGHTKIDVLVSERKKDEKRHENYDKNRLNILKNVIGNGNIKNNKRASSTIKSMPNDKRLNVNRYEFLDIKPGPNNNKISIMDSINFKNI